MNLLTESLTGPELIVASFLKSIAMVDSSVQPFLVNSSTNCWSMAEMSILAPLGEIIVNFFRLIRC